MAEQEIRQTENELITNNIAWFTCPFPARNISVRVFYFLPLRWDKVLFVLHGIYRDATKYLKHWLGTATQRGIAILAPEFSNESFPGDEYACGGVFAPSDSDTPRLRDKSHWSFSVIELAFDSFKQRTAFTTDQYYIYGHSAGAQFVHRCIPRRCKSCHPLLHRPLLSTPIPISAFAHGNLQATASTF
jgi:hypothetical protein